jgi:hypothetical protein
MKTLSYINGIEEDIVIGKTYYFGQLWDGNGDGLELLQSGAITIYDETEEDYRVVWFVLDSNEKEEDILNILVRVTDII